MKIVVARKKPSCQSIEAELGVKIKSLTIHPPSMEYPDGGLEVETAISLSETKKNQLITTLKRHLKTEDVDVIIDGEKEK